jgi:hypothetical protein
VSDPFGTPSHPVYQQTRRCSAEDAAMFKARVLHEYEPDEIAAGGLFVPRDPYSIATAQDLPYDFLALGQQAVAEFARHLPAVGFTHAGHNRLLLHGEGIRLGPGLAPDPIWDAPGWWAALQRIAHLDVGKPVAPPAEPQRVIDASLDFNDLDDIPDAVPLIDGVLDVDTVALLVGKFGTYKSFLALDWAAAVATGQHWQGHRVPVAVPVVYVAGEGVSGMKRRARAWAKTHGSIQRGMFTLIRVATRLKVADDLIQLDQVLKRTGARLLVLDTLHKVAPDIEENSSKDAGIVMDIISQLKERHPGLTVLLAHHSGYGGEHARGSSSLEDDSDTVFLVKLGADGKSEDRSPETPRILVHRKAKDQELNPAIQIKLVAVEGSASAVLDGEPWVPGKGTRDERVPEIAAALDKAGVPATAGRDKIWAECQRLGVPCSADDAREVAKQRKSIRLDLGAGGSLESESHPPVPFGLPGG